MADPDDFASYAVARWAALVRTLVLLGLTPAAADAVVREGLARCASGFGAARREGDVDAWVWTQVLARREPREPTDEAALVVVDPTITDVAEREALLRDVVGRLAALPEPDRLALALALGAGHDPGLVTAIAGVPARPELAPPAPAVTDALAVVPLRADPAAAVLATVRDRRRRRSRIAGVVVVTGLVVTLVLTWVATRSAGPADPLPDVTVTEAVNPVGVAWYGEGALHLADVVVEMPPVRELVEVPDGVVYVDRRDQVVHVDDDGRLTLLGGTTAGGAIAGWVERGWVAWVDVDGGTQELVVHDTRTGSEVARRAAEPELEVLAVDQERVYYDVAGQGWSWRVPGEEPGREPGGTLVDVASAVRLASDGEGALRVSQPLFDVVVTLDGTTGRLSEDGDFVLAQHDGDLPAEVRVYRAADGERLPPHVPSDEVALAAGFGDDRTVVYLVAVREHGPENEDFIRLSETGPLTLRSCDLTVDGSPCQDVLSIANTRGTPVFPH